MPTTVPEPGTGVAQPLVDHREAVRHGLERRAHDVDGPRRQRETHDGGPRAGDPAEAPLPGQEREHRQAVGIGLHRLEHLLHALERGQVEGLGEPRVEAPAIRQGAAQEEATAVHAVAPEAVRDRDRVGRKADPHRAGRPDHERRPLRRRAAGADVGARAVAQRRQPRDARQRGPARRELGPEPAEGLAEVDDGPEVLDAEPEDLEDARVPALRPLVEEAGPRRHRDARAELAEETKPHVLPERDPAPHPAKRGRVALAEPPEPRREIGRVKPASDPRVVRLLVDPRAERLHRADAPRVRPGIDGGRWAIVRSETEHRVPEGAQGDRRHAAGTRAEDGHEGVERLGGQREQPVGVDLDAAVGGRRRLVRLLAPEVESPAEPVEGERPHGGRAHVQRNENRIGRRRRDAHALMLAGGLPT